MSPVEIKSKTVNDTRYSITHWPKGNLYLIHSYDMSLEDDGKAHAELEMAKFDNEKDAIKCLESIK